MGKTLKDAPKLRKRTERVDAKEAKDRENAKRTLEWKEKVAAWNVARVKGGKRTRKPKKPQKVTTVKTQLPDIIRMWRELHKNTL